jgi:hypothetical protein
MKCSPPPRRHVVANVKLVAVRCQLSHVGFPTHRGFRIRKADGSIYGGWTDSFHCFTPEGEDVPEGVPERGQRIPGIVAAQELREDENGVLIYVPDGAVFYVPRSEIVPYPSWATDRVPM